MGMTVARILLSVWLLQLMSLQDATGSKAVCGKPVNSPRIVGGQPATEGSWPWQVNILIFNMSLCGGILINDQWVLSAAHCFPFMPEQTNLTGIELGAYQLSNVSDNTVNFTVKQIIIHPDYNENSTNSDIALLELSSPVKFTNYIMPICLPMSSVQFAENSKCWVTGWGSVESEVDLEPPQTLQEVEVTLIGRDQCNTLLNAAGVKNMPPSPINSDMICAGDLEGGKDACQGDSGGPLVCKCGRSWLLAGIVSWGVGCGLRGLPGVYTLVSSYADWIQQHIPDMNFSECPRNSGLINITEFPMNSGLINITEFPMNSGLMNFTEFPMNSGLPNAPVVVLILVSATLSFL